MRVLAVTRNFPNRLEPLACAFQRQQLACLARWADVEVLAAVPLLPGARLFGDRSRAGRLCRLPRRDTIDGIAVAHPRVPYLPGVASIPLLAPVNAPLYLAGLLPHLRSLRGRFDVVLGTHLFPDACAAVALAALLGLPCVVKAHGTDVNVVAQWPSVRPLVAAALARARYAAGVSRPLVDELVRLGAPPDRAVLLQNGVDRALFSPRDRAEARRAVGVPEGDRVITFVGGLEKEKGLVELFEAYTSLRAEASAPVHLVVVGEGTLDPWLRDRAATLTGARGRLILAGPQPLAGVALHLGAADLLALPSWAEGTPNVVLEALASGRPVVASNVGGIPDVIVDGVTGLLVPPKNPAALSRALGEALARRWDEAALVAAAPPSWDESAAWLFELLWEAARGDGGKVGKKKRVNGSPGPGAGKRLWGLWAR